MLLFPVKNLSFSQLLTLGFGPSPPRHFETIEDRSAPAKPGITSSSTSNYSLSLVPAFPYTVEIIPYAFQSPPKTWPARPSDSQPPEASTGDPEHYHGRATAINSKVILNTCFDDFLRSRIAGIPYCPRVHMAPSGGLFSHIRTAAGT